MFEQEDDEYIITIHENKKQSAFEKWLESLAIIEFPDQREEKVMTLTKRRKDNSSTDKNKFFKY